MTDLSKLFITSKSGKLDEGKLWERIVKISGERLEETLSVKTQGRQNTPLSDNYMRYLGVEFVVFIPNRNRSHYVNALVTFQNLSNPNFHPSTPLANQDTGFICGISVSNNSFAEDLLFQLALDLDTEYDLYFTSNFDVLPAKKVFGEHIKHRLERLNISY